MIAAIVLGSSSGLGHRPLTAVTGVRLPYRVPFLCKKLLTQGLFVVFVLSGSLSACFRLPAGTDIHCRHHA